MYRLRNSIRPYAWGSTTALAEVLGHVPSGMPEAELWIGAHPGAVSHLEDARPLDACIASNPVHMLGQQTVHRFGNTLPFLLKVLAAEHPLSIQVHPTKAQARDGFAAENARGIPLTAPHRNYRDANHKPEMLFALTPFEALCGFRPPQESAHLFSFLDTYWNVPFVGEIASALADPSGRDESALVRHAFENILHAGPPLQQALHRLAALAQEKTAENDPALLTLFTLVSAYPTDPGVLLSLLFNHVVLRPGECLALPAGQAHAYLHGLGVEVMASSDNVLRGGLSAKHIDTGELMKILDFLPRQVPRIFPQALSPQNELFHAGFPEFQLQHIAVNESASISLEQHGPVLFFVLDGNGVLRSPSDTLSLHKGESAFLPAMATPIRLLCDGPCQAFAVTTAPS